jgi:ATP-dependent helicase HrpB
MLLNYAKDVRPADDSAAGQLLLRWLCLKKWRPEVELPEVNDAIFAEVLPEVCRGCRSLSEVASADWVGAFRGRLTWEQWQRLEREAPAALDVPSGRSVALQYELGRPPVLAAKIQELFGLAETPRIADGTVKVLVHLLAPNGRPQQVTDDLASFWANTYALVRKDLRGRYPKHDWPENPYEAVASRGVRRRD